MLGKREGDGLAKPFLKKGQCSACLALRQLTLLSPAAVKPGQMFRDVYRHPPSPLPCCSQVTPSGTSPISTHLQKMETDPAPFQHNSLNVAPEAGAGGLEQKGTASRHCLHPNTQRHRAQQSHGVPLQFTCSSCILSPAYKPAEDHVQPLPGPKG